MVLDERNQNERDIGVLDNKDYCSNTTISFASALNPIFA